MKKKDKEPSKVYIEYDEIRTGGEPEDDSMYSYREDAYITVDFKCLHKSQPKHRFFYDSKEVPEEFLKKDRLYLAVVRYSTGDTFGHTEGAWHIVDVCDSYKAAHDLLEEEIKPSTKGYKPWEGYFERFERTEIHELFLV